MIADKDYPIITIKHKDTTLTRIYLDKGLLMTLMAHLLTEVREAASPEDFTDSDDILDRINYIKDLSESLDVIQSAIREIGYSERLEDIPDDNE